MKKISVILFSMLIAFFAIAQDSEGNKNDVNLLPESGDFALGFDAVPVIDFALNAVNLMNNTGSTAQHPSYVSGYNQIIVGKYFLEDDMAVRIRVGINSTRVTDKNYGDDPLTSDPNPDNILLETNKTRNSDFFIGGGIEMRRGYNRLQGYYGGEALIGTRSTNIINSYEIDYNANAAAEGYMVAGSSRVLHNKSGTSITFGARCFVGIEYFIAPKISIGAEFGWGVGVRTAPRGSVETEFWGIEPGSTATDPYQYTIETKGNTATTNFDLGVDDGISRNLGASAALTLLFHF